MKNLKLLSKAVFVLIFLLGYTSSFIIKGLNAKNVNNITRWEHIIVDGSCGFGGVNNKENMITAFFYIIGIV